MDVCAVTTPAIPPQRERACKLKSPAMEATGGRDSEEVTLSREQGFLFRLEMVESLLDEGMDTKAR